MLSSFIAWQTPKLVSRRPIGEEPIVGVLGLVRPPRMSSNIAESCDEYHIRDKKGCNRLILRVMLVPLLADS